MPEPKQQWRLLMPEDEESKPITPPGSEAQKKRKTVALVPVALPGSVVELAKYRKSKAKLSIADECERVCLALWEVAEFQGFLKAFRNEDASKAASFCQMKESAPVNAASTQNIV